MNVTLKAQYTATARFDYIKLRFHNTDLAFTEYVREIVLMEFIKLQASAPTVALKDPKFVTIEPSPNKPNGLYIVEIYGFAAELVKGLPAGWLQYVTYAHVKAFAHGMRYAQLQELTHLYQTRQARRTATTINPGRAGRSKKGQTANPIRIGSRKSDWHGVIYARKGFAPGFEGRYRDEGLYGKTLAALDFWNNGEMPDMAAWLHFLRAAASDTASIFETDAMQRDINLEDYIESFGSWARASAEQHALDIDDDDVIDPPQSFDGTIATEAQE